MMSVMNNDDFAVECCTNMILVHVSAYVIYDVRILQLLHIFYVLRFFATVFSILLPWQPIK